MSSDQVLTLFIAVVTSVGASFVTGLLSRPKTRADAVATEAGGQVAISGDARAWAQQFADQAAAANTHAAASDARATEAEKRAREAEDKVEEVLDRVSALESKMILFVNYTGQLRQAIIDLDGHPPAPPASLVPPL